MEETEGSGMLERAKKLIGFYNAMGEKQTTPERKADDAEELVGETWGMGIRTGMRKLGGRYNPVWFKQATNGEEQSADSAQRTEEVEETDEVEEQTEEARRAEIQAGKRKAL